MLRFVYCETAPYEVLPGTGGDAFCEGFADEDIGFPDEVLQVSRNKVIFGENAEEIGIGLHAVHLEQGFSHKGGGLPKIA